MLLNLGPQPTPVYLSSALHLILRRIKRNHHEAHHRNPTLLVRLPKVRHIHLFTKNTSQVWAFSILPVPKVGTAASATSVECKTHVRRQRPAPPLATVHLVSWVTGHNVLLGVRLYAREETNLHSCVDGKDCVAEPYNQKIRGPEFHNTCLQFLGGADSCCTRVERVGGPIFRSDGCKGT
jgi:hypothetical protein